MHAFSIPFGCWTMWLRNQHHGHGFVVELELILGSRVPRMYCSPWGVIWNSLHIPCAGFVWPRQKFLEREAIAYRERDKE